MPKKFAIRMPSHPVLNVIFPLRPSVIPFFLRGLTIVGMDCFHPIESQAFVKAEPSERNPLGAWPSPTAVWFCQEDKLRNTRGQQTKPLLTLLQTPISLVLLSTVSGNLDESCVALQRHHEARRPKTRAVLSLV